MLIIRKKADVATLKLMSNNNIIELLIARVDGRLYKYDKVLDVYKPIDNYKLITKIEGNPWIFHNHVVKTIDLKLISDEALNTVHNSLVSCISNQSVMFKSPAFCDYMCGEFKLSGTLSQEPVELFNDLVENNNLPEKVLDIVNKIKDNNLIRKNGLFAIASLCGFGTRYIPANLQNKMCDKIIEEYPERAERDVVFMILELLNKEVLVKRLMDINNMVNNYHKYRG